MTGENKDKKIKRTPAEENPWYWLMLTTTFFDKGQTPNGWHWFVALHCLLKFDFKAEQAELPDKHPLKSENLSLEATKETLKDIISEFKNKIKLEKTSIIDFTALCFLEETDFSNFIFPIPVSFGCSKFHKSVNFTLASFYLPSIFSDTVFFDDVHFDKTTFYSELAFQNTSFFKEVYFMEAKFLGGAIFNDATFSNVSGCVHFEKAIFSSAIFFNNTKFYGKAFFYSVKFSSYTTFENATFKFYAPKFYGAEINDEITWTGIKLPKFEKTDDKETNKNYKKRIESNQNAYENLSTKLGNQNKYHDEHFFFRHETRCRQELEKNIISFWAFWFYENVSDYGYGVGHAIATWFLHIIIGALILFYIRSVDQPDVSLDDFGCSLGISLSNSHAFFFKGDRLKNCYDTFESLPAFNFIWGLQTITGTLLIFLVLLTLRVRFRLK